MHISLKSNSRLWPHLFNCFLLENYQFLCFNSFIVLQHEKLPLNWYMTELFYCNIHSVNCIYVTLLLNINFPDKVIVFIIWFYYFIRLVLMHSSFLYLYFLLVNLTVFHIRRHVVCRKCWLSAHSVFASVSSRPTFSAAENSDSRIIIESL